MRTIRTQSTQQPSTKVLAVTATGAAAVFPVIVFSLNLLQISDGYSTTRQAVSELALGRGGALMAVAFCSLGLGTLLLGAVIARTTEHARVPVALLTLAGVLSFVSAAFHTDLTGAHATTHGNIHNAAGIITFLAMLVTMAIESRRFRKEEAWRRIANPTVVLTGAGVVTFFLIPVLGAGHFGLSQRLFISTFVIWTLTASVHAVRTISAVDRAPQALGNSATPSAC